MASSPTSDCGHCRQFGSLGVQGRVLWCNPSPLKLGDAGSILSLLAYSRLPLYQEPVVFVFELYNSMVIWDFLFKGDKQRFLKIDRGQACEKEG